MLVNFRFKNCRSFLAESNLSLNATNGVELQELNTFNVDENLLPKGENELLKAAVIFGNNASGKSNVLKALDYMRNVILFSASQAPISLVSKNEYFAFLEGADKEESLYEVEIIENNTFYQYGFCLLEGRITQEWLNKRKDRRLTPVFTRTNNELNIVGKENNLSNIINVSPQTLFISISNNFHLSIAPYLLDVMKWFQRLYIIFDNNTNALDIYDQKDGKYKDEALRILKLADIGISDMNVVKDKIASVEDSSLGFNMPISKSIGQIKQENKNLYNIDLETFFNTYDKDGNKKENKSIRLFKNYGFNSEGTERLLYCLGFLLSALDEGRVIFLDEIDSKLHFLVADYLLGLFNSLDKNPKNSQLVCTAHNILLMDENLRRDQIYFTSKNERGESNLSALSDYKNVRKNDLFSKKYLAGFYSSLPNVSNDD